MGRVDGVGGAPAPERAELAPDLSVTVVYSPHAGVVDEVRLRLPSGASIEDAVRASGLRERHSALDLATAAVGVWGALRAPQDLLRDADRVEVYRPLVVDPKEARRRRQQIQRNAIRPAR
jgi:putative ubiquitin-RnfH superfamily antitoxin RatB of RatAB toxin-antitoxin module